METLEYEYQHGRLAAKILEQRRGFLTFPELHPVYRSKPKDCMHALPVAGVIHYILGNLYVYELHQVLIVALEPEPRNSIGHVVGEAYREPCLKHAGKFQAEVDGNTAGVWECYVFDTLGEYEGLLREAVELLEKLLRERYGVDYIFIVADEPIYDEKHPYFYKRFLESMGYRYAWSTPSLGDVYCKSLVEAEEGLGEEGGVPRV